ncbi:CDP-glucose 4,6-dehydratase [Synechococcus sp. HK05]|uniref:CDP-glucose 4,6-dehydratase n=1 Tax=Synechococcus sp. HK05 TaxID=2725975 RepID=UPI001C37E983|nr:CDP-glucose 4,6-dehydratase [Synechococcus sp. HK05]MBV2352090.1 CDP-glucose 4,6-dehydratase [Synechococcus sp. HK05]
MTSIQSFSHSDRQFWHSQKVLLTGHTGFKGSWLAFWLKELGAQVTGVALEQEGRPNLFDQLQLKRLIDHRVGDIRDPDLLKAIVNETQPTVVFHLAAQPLVRHSYEEPVATWSTNVMGTIHLLEALRLLDQPCSTVLITTDKVYRNNEWVYGYRENDPLGGHDPYSSSKAAAEIAIASWRSSFCGTAPHQTPHLRVASARAGNVIGGGDWAQDRIVPDAMRALSRGEAIVVRNPRATRPWQHVLEPLGGYLQLAEYLSTSAEYSSAFNFGPHLEANRPVRELVEEALRHWPGAWHDQSDPHALHEASRLNLVIDKAHHQLGWAPRWDFATTVERTINWYRRVQDGQASALECCRDDLAAFLTPSPA